MGSGARIALVDADEKSSAAVSEVLCSAGADVTVVRSMLDAACLYPVDIVAINYDSLSEQGRRDLIDLLAHPDSDRNSLILSGKQIRKDLVDIFTSHGVSNLIARNPDVDADELLVTIRKILNRDIFGLDKYF